MSRSTCWPRESWQINSFSLGSKLMVHPLASGPIISKTSNSYIKRSNQLLSSFSFSYFYMSFKRKWRKQRRHLTHWQAARGGTRFFPNDRTSWRASSTIHKFSVIICMFVRKEWVIGKRQALMPRTKINELREVQLEYLGISNLEPATSYQLGINKNDETYFFSSATTYNLASWSK